MDLVNDAIQKLPQDTLSRFAPASAKESPSSPKNGLVKIIGGAPSSRALSGPALEGATSLADSVSSSSSPNFPNKVDTPFTDDRGFEK